MGSQSNYIFEQNKREWFQCGTDYEVQTKRKSCHKGCCGSFLPCCLVRVVEPTMWVFEVALAHTMALYVSEEVLPSPFVGIVPSFL
jgi:hypothetical protein